MFDLKSAPWPVQVDVATFLTVKSNPARFTADDLAAAERLLRERLRGRGLTDADVELIARDVSAH